MRMSPPSLLLRVVLPVNVIGLANDTFALVACKEPERLTVPPDPLSVKAPPRVEELTFKVKRPVWAIWHGPFVPELNWPLIWKATPERWMPPLVLVLRF